MKRQYLTLMALLTIGILFASSLQVYSNNDMDRARELVTVGTYEQAIELLNRRISHEPTDAEAHFLLGVCLLQTGNSSGAEEHFASAVRLGSRDSHRIGEEYKNAGIDALSKGRTGKALILFQKSVRYAPGFRTEIAKACLEAAKSYLDEQRGNEATGLLQMAVEYDNSLYEEKTKMMRDYGKRLLAIAMEKPKEERETYVVEAFKYLPEEDIDEILPPPKWQTVFEEIYFGRGIKGDKSVPTVRFNKDILYGDKIIITEHTGETFYVADGNRWMEHKNRYEVINDYSGSEAAFLYVQAKAGVKLRLQIQRQVISY